MALSSNVDHLMHASFHQHTMGLGPAASQHFRLQLLSGATAFLMLAVQVQVNFSRKRNAGI
jgi:hypothetical protein